MSKTRALYNEIDPYCVAWLKNLISRGLIADGDVADCSIADIRPSDLRGYTQFHTFAGIGIWSYSMRRAGIPDSAPWWTGSCPCQPFSAAGKGGGFDDERHLWPAFHHLIRECRPAVVLGEQVASKDGLAWVDLVQSDMEGTGYAFGAIDTCSAGFGAPHIRQRLRFAAHRLADASRSGSGTGLRDIGTNGVGRLQSADGGAVRSLADASGGQLPQPLGRAQGRNGDGSDCPDHSHVRGLGFTPGGGREWIGSQSAHVQPVQAVQGSAGQLADAHGGHTGLRDIQRSGQHGLGPQDGIPGGSGPAGIGHNSRSELERPGPVNGFWRDADWLYCRDGKWRPVEGGTFPLAHGDPARVGRLRAFGNAVDAEATTEFCVSVKEAIAHALHHRGTP